MVLKQASSGDSTSEPKKRRRVGFANIDVGVEANECIKIFFVSSEEEVGSEESFRIDPIDLNQFFGEDGRIYGYRDLKINVWLSSISFRAYADITYKSTNDGGKGITDLVPALQKIFGESLVEERDDFLRTFSTEFHFIRSVISNGKVLHHDTSKKCDESSSHQADGKITTIDVIRMGINSTAAGEVYSRLVSLALLLVDGSSPIDITDPRWELYLEVERKKVENGDAHVKLVGFAATYRFYHYPDSWRLRISQILVFPPYQGQGHGRLILQVLNSVAVAENAYDITVEEPSDYLQHVRTCIDILRLLKFEPIKPAVTSCLKEGNFSETTPPVTLVKQVRQKLKICRKQFLQCWEILIYLHLDQNDCHCMEKYRTLVAERIKVDILGKDDGLSGKRVIQVPNAYDHDMTFVMFSPITETREKLVDNDAQIQKHQEEQLGQLVDERMEQIKQISDKVSSYHQQ